MKEVLQVVADMETALNCPSDPYDTFPSTPTITTGIPPENTLARPRTGSISINRSRSNSLVRRVRSRQSSISE